MAGNKNKIYSVLRELLSLSLSDIHLLEDKPVYIRDGSGKIKPLQDKVLEKDDIWGFMHDFLSKDKINYLLDGHEIDAAYTLDDVRFRINAYQDSDGIRLAMRKISARPPSLEDINLDGVAEDFLLKDKGLILVTGPTGSGKSTSLAAMLDYINKNKNSHIVTLEDPIEYVFENKNSLVTQRSIGKNTQSWKDAMKYSLRQDPDVIMIGEMRDLETISSALTLVETGHLVISTLHTVDAPQTISRIIDVFPPHQQEQVAVQLSMGLQLSISQRLLPTADGVGRAAAREVLVNTSAVANNIRERRIPQVSSIMETGAKYGMKTMDYSMAELVNNKKVDLNTVLPKISNTESFKNILKGLRNENTEFNPID